MPIKGIEQPEYIEIDKEIRLRKFNGKYDFAFEWYQDTDTLWMLDGDKNYRKKGIATKVIRKLIERGKELGYKELEIEEIYSWNLDSQKLYTNLGFKPFKETKNGMSYKLIL